MNEITDTAVRALMRDYAHTLDRGRLGEWPSYFTDECLYRITTRQNEERGFPLSMMQCNNKAMLFDRIEATEKANVYEPHYYRHILSDTEIVGRAASHLKTRTNFLCVRTMLNSDMTLFAVGEYLDEIEQHDQRLLFRARSVVLDHSRIDTLIAIPL